jgi:2',3'-cyclic-nucleotide 2'-phosphodiesterase (5'-nucleotidase family)
MEKYLKRIFFVVLILFLTLAMLPQPNLILAEETQGDPVIAEEQNVSAGTKTLRIIETADLHGQIQNYDYYTGKAFSATSKKGMSLTASYVAKVRAANPNTLLIDDGDTIQGSPVNYYFNVLHPEVTNPMAVAMNYMNYSAMTLGNHEFNFGKTVLDKFISEANFPVLAANVRKTSDNSLVFAPYTIKTVDDVQVGILGLTNQSVPYWEKPENIAGWTFTNPVTEAQTFVPIMKAAGADVIVIAAHSGMDETYGHGWEENFIKALADNVPSVDVILAAHAHALVNTTRNGVLITEPRNAGRDLADITITVSGSGSDWAVTAKSAVMVDVSAAATILTEDPAYLSLLKPYHDATVAYINTPVGSTTGPFPGGYAARVQDGPTADLINLVQSEAAAAAGFPVDASCAALFNNAALLPSGTLLLKDIYALYIYDNTLYVVEATGQTVKEVLEWTVSYFYPYDFSPAGPKTNYKNMADYNLDMWTGIEYTIDLTKPVGQRITKLMLNGEPLGMDQKIRVAANNYRATGMFTNPQAVTIPATILYSSTTEVRDLIVNYVTAHSPLDPNAIYVHNWDLYPDYFLRPTEVMDRSTFLSLVSDAFGKPGSQSFIFADAAKGTALVVDLDNMLFQYFAKDKSYGILKIPSLVYPRPGYVQFFYKSSFLIVSATLNVYGGYGSSVVDVYDLFNKPGYPAPERLISYDNFSTFNTERALTFLVNLGMKGIVSPLVDWASLQSFSDWKSISPWSSAAYTFMTKNVVWDKLNPSAPVTNAAALSWVSEARYPLLSFISTSDFHGALDASTVSSTKMGGAAVDNTYIKSYRALNPLGTFLVDSGDNMQGTLISNFFKGASTIDVLNQIGYQVSAIGNHEFDWGQDILQQRISEAHFPWLNCNIFLKGTNVQPSWLKPYVILEAKGMKIGLIGIIGTDAPSKIMPGNVDNLDFKNPAPIVNQIAADLRAQGVNVVVVLAHMGGSQDSTGVITGDIAVVANQLVGVNYIAAGDMHNKLNSIVNGIPITEPYSSGTALGLAKIRIDRLTGATFLSGLKTADDLLVNSTYNLGITPDPAIAAVVAGYNAQIAVIKNQWIGTINGPINRDTPDRYTQESAVGNLIADSMAWKAGVAIAFMNPGGIRANIVSPTGTYPYNVIWNDLYTVQPFDNLLTSMDLTGAQIKALLEQCYAPANPGKKLLQVTGIRFSVTVSNPDGTRITSLTLADGTPIVPTSTYRIVTNNYLATGGDNFSVFKQGTNLVTGGSDITAFVDYVLWKWGTPPANTPFTSVVEGRITVVP